MDESDTGFNKRLNEIFSGAGTGGTRHPGSRAIIDGKPEVDISRIFRAGLEQCGATATGKAHYGLLLLMQLTDSSAVIVRRTRALFKSSLRSSDSVWIWGEGRLAVLVDGLRDSSDGPLVAGKIHDILRNPYAGQLGSGFVQAWSGASVFRLDANASEYWWCLARSELRRALQASAGTCCFCGLVNGRTLMAQVDLIKEAYQAYRNQQFSIAYQPIFGMQAERITGVEALLRWQHPQQGLLDPRTVIASLEESGLIVPLGEWILNEACQVARKLSQKTSSPMRVCVNVSARQLADPGFLLTVLDAVYDADIEADRLQLECPAEVIERHSRSLRTTLLELAHAGVRIAVDQFGGGKTVLTALLDLPVTLIKIDRALVGGVADNAVSRAIASSTLAMANAAGMSVAAVGVEDQVQMRVLRQMGCSEAQGYVLSRPRAAADLLSWLPA